MRVGEKGVYYMGLPVVVRIISLDCPIQGQSGIERPTGSVVPLHPQGRVDQGTIDQGQGRGELPRSIMLILINVFRIG
ncbi:hypothetical protein HAX54_052869 [Datura stramonium]|uniref:Uncharacterized protein n=1 Tax=Datura stramonium TaxID=4076 RepID=A0ABS8RTD2_DATST|nr:hypothetical protein [Datura stramonium]